MDMMEIIISAAMIYHDHKKNQAKKNRRRRRWWVRPIYSQKYRQGDYHNLVNEMRLSDPEMFFMTVELFDNLLAMVGPLIKKKSNRPSIPEGARLACTLRMLAAGDSLQTLAFAYRMSKSVICNIIKETCNAIWEVLQPVYLPTPTQDKWKQVAHNFNMHWNLPNCVGAVDGKHVAIIAPANSGSEYFNYKKYFSIVLFGVCDPSYLFIYVDIGSYGSQSDGGIFRQSEFGKQLLEGNLNLPEDSYLPGTNQMFPHFFVGDEAFPLLTHFLRPYSGKYLDQERRIFNYRLSRARRCIENAFGILASRWRIFQKTINARPDTVDSIIQATVALHNYIMVNEPTNVKHKYSGPQYTDRENLETGEVVHGEWRRESTSSNTALAPAAQFRRLGSRNARNDIVASRDVLKDYLNSNAGSVPWQMQLVS